MAAQRNPHIELARRWGPALLWMGLIFFMSAQSVLPAAQETWLDLLIKKGGHMAAYAILAGLLWRAVGPTPASTKQVVLVWVLAVLYAVSDEVHQLFVPGRHGTLLDVLIDSAGALIAVLLLRKRTLRRFSQSAENILRFM